MLTSHVFLLKPKRAINHMLRMMALTIYALSRNARISALVFELFVMASNGILQYFQICSEGCLQITLKRNASSATAERLFHF